MDELSSTKDKLRVLERKEKEVLGSNKDIKEQLEKYKHKSQANEITNEEYKASLEEKERNLKKLA